MSFEYTEKEKKGIDKVERMNRFFDKVFVPAVGVLVIITLVIFISFKVIDKLGASDVSASDTVSSNTVSQPAEFLIREYLLENYDEYSVEFSAYGYEEAEGYSQDVALCKTVDDELVIYQFLDDTIGDFTIMQYSPTDGEYDYVALTLSSDTLINVTLSESEEKYKVTFKSGDFSSYNEDDAEQYASMMQFISEDELVTLYELFRADIDNLAEICGIEDEF